MSLAEATFNNVIGYGVSVAGNFAVLPWFGYTPSVADSLEIGLAFTGISLVRSYILRRLFNAVQPSEAPPSAGEISIPAKLDPLFTSIVMPDRNRTELVIGIGCHKSFRILLSRSNVMRLAAEAATAAWKWRD